MCNTNLTTAQLVSILNDAQQLVQHARAALTLHVVHSGIKSELTLGFYEDECKEVHKSVDKILEAVLVVLHEDERQEVRI